MIIKVKVKPMSKEEGVVKLSEDTYEVKVRAVPEGGKANERLIELLSKHFKVPKSSVKILRGNTSRNKLIEINFKF